METGLKKIWTRQRGKSKSRHLAGDARPQFKETPTYEVHASGPPPQLIALPFKPSKAAKVQNVHHNVQSGAMEEARGPEDADAAVRPQAAGGIQPVFVGISRPATASSFAEAVSQAADNVVRGRPTTARAIAPIEAGRQRASKARYIDIFQITAQPQIATGRYNEDVAARNLDLRQVALGAPAYSYDPTSKYQEEVAIRNASVELRRPSLDVSTYSQDEPLSSYESTQESKVISHDDLHAYLQNALTRGDTVRTGRLPDHRTTQQPRMYSMTARALAAQLPVIPQETQAEAPEVPQYPRARGKDSESKRQKSQEVQAEAPEVPRYSRARGKDSEPKKQNSQEMQAKAPEVPRYSRARGKNSELEKQNSQEMQAEAPEVPRFPHARGQNPQPRQQQQIISNAKPKGKAAVLDKDTSHLTIPPHSSRVPWEMPSKTSSPAHVSRPLMNRSATGYSNASVQTQHSTASMPTYNVSAAELFRDRPRLDRSTTNQPPTRSPLRKDDGTYVRWKDGNSHISSTAPSKAYALKKSVNLSNRTVMDLTGNDSEIFSDLERAVSYTESPELRQAHISPMYSARPSVVGSGHIDSNTMNPSRLGPRHAMPKQPYLDLADVETSQRARVVEEAIRKVNLQKNDFPDAGDFTPEASSPKISFSQINTVASVSPRPSVVVADLPASVVSQPNTEGTEGILHNLNSLPEATKEATRANDNPPDSDWASLAGDRREDSMKGPYVHVPSSSLSTAIGEGPTSPLHTKAELSPVDEDVPNQTPFTRRQPEQEQSRTLSPLAVYASPESLQSSDFVHPGGAFGVYTRDFAKTPSSPAASQQSNGVESRPSSSGQGKKRVDFALDYSPQIIGHYQQASPARSARRRDEMFMPSYTSTFDEEGFARKQIQAKAALLRLQKSLEEDGFHQDLDSQLAATSRYLAAPSPAVSTRPKVPTSIYATNRRTESAPNVYGSSKTPQPSPMSYHNMVTTPSPAPSNQSSPEQRSYFSKRSSGNTSSTYDSTGTFSTGMTLVHQTFEPHDLNPVSPISPGDGSSSFPLTSGSAGHSRQASFQRPWTKRRNSNKSTSSTASAFSIPYHLVPGRASSIRNFDDGFSLYEEE